MTKFRKSKNPKKKYDALTPRGRWVSFGSRTGKIFKDSTPLKLYKHLEHNDQNIRKAWKARHSAIKLKDGTPAYLDKEQSSYYSYNFLW